MSLGNRQYVGENDTVHPRDAIEAVPAAPVTSPAPTARISASALILVGIADRCWSLSGAELRLLSGRHSASRQTGRVLGTFPTHISCWGCSLEPLPLSPGSSSSSSPLAPFPGRAGGCSPVQVSSPSWLAPGSSWDQ